MTAPPARSSKLPIILGVFALLFLAFAFGLRMWWFAAAPPPPSVFDGLPESNSEADQLSFQARLRQRYLSKSSDESALERELSAEGFAVDRKKRTATFERRAGLADKCRYSANIRWTASEGATISDITGGYLLRCPEH
jgi:hypothetical protein